MTQANKVVRHFLLLDNSGSMAGRADSLIRVVDSHVKWLAEESRTSGQEGRISIFTFNSKVDCLIYDTDVLRYKTIRGLYRTGGNTALLSAFLKSQSDLDNLDLAYGNYGEHNFFTVVFTDGRENWSHIIENSPQNAVIGKVKRILAHQADNRTVACMVPDVQGKISAVQWGFPQGNVAIWDTASPQGVEEAGETLRGATRTLLDTYTTGARSSRTVFAGGDSQVNADTIAQAGLKPLDSSKYVLVPVANPGDALKTYTYAVKRDPKQRTCVLINEFVERANHKYIVGKTFYQLTDMSQRVQANKLIAVVNKQTNEVFLGEAARRLLELPNREVTLKREPNSKYEVFIASHSTNRLLPLGTRVLLLV